MTNTRNAWPAILSFEVLKKIVRNLLLKAWLFYILELSKLFESGKIVGTDPRTCMQRHV